MNGVGKAALHPGQIGVLVALLNQGRSAEAEQEAMQLLPLHPGQGMLWKILGAAQMRQDKDAIQALQRAAALMPRDAEVHANLGAALRARGLWSPALASLNRALELEPDDVNLLVETADALRALGRAAESIPLYRRGLRINPGDIEATNNLGNAFLELVRPIDAADQYRGALQFDPDNVAVMCNLGRALLQSGDLAEAAATTRRAIAVDPTSSIAHHSLGMVLSRQGLLEQAAASLRRALELNPRSVETLNALGKVLADLGSRNEAAAVFRRSIEFEPRQVEGHVGLGNVLFELRRFEDAIASHRRALALQPGHAPALVSLGITLRQQGRPEEAQSAGEAALASDSNNVEAMLLLGELHADRGRFTEAELLFQRAIRVNPDFSYAYSSVATHRKMTSDDSAWLAGAEALLAKELPPAQEAGIRYSLGKYFDDVGRYDSAFEHYRQANELTKRYRSAYVPGKFTSYVNAIVDAFDASFLREISDRGSDADLPVFVIGMPRSGTSLAEQILASHPAIFGAGEVTYWDRAYAVFHGSAQGAGAAMVPALARDYLARLSLSAGGAVRVVDKLPANFLYAGLIHASLPRARIIHMQRHPIDTCLSIYFQNFLNMGAYANDLDHLAHYYGEYLRIMSHWRAVLPETALLEVPYEALIEDQEGWSRRMVEFLGLPWDPQCLDFHRTERVVLTASKWQVRQKIHSGSAGRWKNYEEFVAPLSHLPDLLRQH
jgi:tetratricopeptide (TPR) repeat protein